MRIAIVDDEEIWRTKTEEEIRAYNFGDYTEIEKYASGENFLKGEKEYNIVFLDVEMHRIDGFQTATAYGAKFPNTIIVILTTHTELSRKGYRVNAFRYIDKANMEEEIQEALMSAELVLKRNQTIEVEVAGLGKMPIVLSDIIYVESINHIINIHTEAEVLSSYAIRMNELEGRLLEFGFFRCHKSYIVNLDKIRDFSRTEIVMKDGSSILVSVRKYQELKRRYLEYKFKYANS